jgi:type I restriction enzyme S subunit
MTTVGDWLELTYGKALKEADRDGGAVPVVGSGGVVGGHSSGLTTGPTIVVGRKGSIGSVTWIEGPAWPIDTAYFVTPRRSDLDMRWAFWMLQSLGMSSMNKSAAVPGLNRDDVYRLPVNVPAIGVQRRIAAILDQADAIRTKRQQVLAHLDELTQSVFRDMFGDGVGDDAVSLGSVADVKGGKRLPKGAEYSPVPTAHPYIRVTDLRGGNIAPSNLLYLPDDVQARIARYTVDAHDVVISIAGSIGLTAEVPPTLAGANLTENAAKIVPKADAPYLGSWLAFALRTPQLQGQIAGKTGQVTIGKLALFRIEQLELSIPPLKLQKEFASRIEVISAQRAVVERAVAVDDELFASLQSRAFRGEL